MKKGDLIFVSGKGIGAKIIQWFVGPNNHIAFYCGHGKIIETSAKTGVDKGELSKYNDKNKYTVTVGRVDEATSEDIFQINTWLRHQIGEHYDFLQIVAMMWYRITHRLHRRTHIDDNSLDVCSTLLGRAFKTRGFIFNQDIHINNLSPQDIFDSKIVRILGKL